MTSVEEAKQKIARSIQPLAPVSISVSDALGYALAEDVIAQMPLPPFSMSAMDGYALGQPDGTGKFELVGEIKAGDPATIDLKTAEAVRIFTGAPVPESACAIEMQEKVERQNNHIQLSEPVAQGKFIRPKGGQIETGKTVFQTGEILSPPALGLLVSLGLENVLVFPKPHIELIVTGNELIEPGQPALPGQIYESNSITLGSALHKNGFALAQVHKVLDDFEATKNTIAKALSSSTVVLLSGGISVGDYDFVGKALTDLGVETVFYKVKQKPGKPLFFGRKNNTLEFALPGNPASALVCYYQFVLPSLNQLSNLSPNNLPIRQSNLGHAVKGIPDKTQFLRGIFGQDGVHVNDGQDSHMLHSFARANVLICIPPHQGELKKGAEIEIHILP